MSSLLLCTSLGVRVRIYECQSVSVCMCGRVYRSTSVGGRRNDWLTDWSADRLMIQLIDCRCSKPVIIDRRPISWSVRFTSLQVWTDSGLRRLWSSPRGQVAEVRIPRPRHIHGLHLRTVHPTMLSPQPRKFSRPPPSLMMRLVEGAPRKRGHLADNGLCNVSNWVNTVKTVDYYNRLARTME